MEYFLFILKSAFEDFRRNKIRTALTSLGILIGVASVVILIAFGLGLKKYIKGQFESLGTNLIIVLPGKILENGSFSSSSESALSGANFDEKDLASITKIEKATYVLPVFMKTVAAEGEGKEEIGDLYATSSDIFFVRNLEIEYGELFTKSDVDKRSKKVVLGPEIAKKIFGSTFLAVGRTIKIENQGFKVIGVLKSKGGGGLGGPNFDSFIYLPYKSALSFNPEKRFTTLLVKVGNEEDIAEVKEKIKEVLQERYDEDDFSVIEQTEILNAVSSIFSMINMVLIAIAAISLVVGGIGIMNIMYISILERTREIGIRRALGATRKDVLFQFIFEAVTLSLFGGFAGLLISFIFVLIIQKFFPAYIDINGVSVALGVSSFIGIIFGVLPARRAANLSPIEAIRYE